MKRSMIFFLLCMMSVVMVPAHHVEPATAASDAPYIYFYSDILNAFVVERADGTNSHVLGKGIFDHDVQLFDGAGWSSSGEWFGVVGLMRYPSGHQEALGAALLSLDDKPQPEVFSNLGLIDWMAWAGDSDILLVSTQNQTVTAQGVQRERDSYHLIQLSMDTPIASLEIAPFYSSQVSIIWHESSEQFLLGYDDAELNERRYYGIDLAGKISLLHQAVPHVYRELDAQISTQGWTVDWIDNELAVVQNLISDVQFALPELTQLTQVIWSPDGIKATLVTSTSTWLMDVGNQTATPIEHIPSSLFHNRWSPDSRYFLTGEAPDLSLIDTSNGEIMSIDALDAFDRTSSFHWRWEGNNQLLIAAASRQLDSDDQYLISFENGRFSSPALDFTSYEPPFFSPDRQFYGYVDGGSVIVDLETNEVNTFLPHQRSIMSFPDGTLYWHPTEPWLFSFQTAFVAGGNMLPHWVSVDNASTGQHRDLGYCGIINDICAGWLPTGAVNDLTKGLDLSPLDDYPQPTLKIDFGEWGDWLAWSVDGDYLMVNDEQFEVKSGLARSSKTDFLRASGSLTHNASQQFSIRSANGQFEVIENTSQQVVLELTLEHIVVSAFSSDNKVLALNTGRITQLWDLEDGSLLVELPVTALNFAFSPDGTKLAAGVSWEVWIWDVADLVEEG